MHDDSDPTPTPFPPGSASLDAAILEASAAWCRCVQAVDALARRLAAVERQGLPALHAEALDAARQVAALRAQHALAVAQRLEAEAVLLRAAEARTPRAPGPGGGL